jgi:hypothetical protein
VSDDELEPAVRRLRAEGYAPKEIARALGVRPAVVAPLVRMIAAERANTATVNDNDHCSECRSDRRRPRPPRRPLAIQRTT